MDVVSSLLIPRLIAPPGHVVMKFFTSAAKTGLNPVVVVKLGAAALAGWAPIAIRTVATAVSRTIFITRGYKTDGQSVAISQHRPQA